MKKKQVKDYPGCIFARKGRIYVKYKNRQYKTGLEDTPENRDLVAKDLKKRYRDFQILSGEVPLTGMQKRIYYLWEQFIDYQKERNKMPKTIRTYNNAFHAIAFEDREFTELQIIWIVERMKFSKTLSPSSKNIYLRHFQVFLNWVIDTYHLEIPGLRKIYKKYHFVVSDKIVEPYNDEEFEKLINVVNSKDREFALLLLFLRYSGFRIKETLNLEWKDVDYRNNVILIPNKIHKQMIERFPLSDILHKILSEIKSFNNQDKLFRWQASSQSSLNKRLMKIENICGIKVAGQSFHRFRNTFSNEILTNKLLTIPEMSDLMRHKSINTTYKMYHKANYQDLGDKLNKIHSNGSKKFNQSSTFFDTKHQVSTSFDK